MSNLIAACVGSPLIKAGTAHAVLTTEFRHRHAALGLRQDRHDLAIGKT
ncbi:hypothetical protein LCGC14_0880370 [marine sediment metagenome]|uniref:Uncharacterized protein n=1 Tax=marine sediment metagenome TaxID=412755 RepID=A0A0F9P244_9ZZZZ